MEQNNHTRDPNLRTMRPTTTVVWKDTAKTKAASESISIDSARLWNCAPLEVKNAHTLWAAKKAIKIYCKNLEF